MTTSKVPITGRYLAVLTLLLLLGVWLQTSCAADEVGVKEAREQRLRFMKRTLGELKLTFQGKPDEILPLSESPVLRFSNPVRSSTSDGGVFLWLAGQRPVAAATIWIRAKGQYGHDFTSLSAEPLSCLRKDKVVWSPPRGLLIRQPLAKAAKPSLSPPLRLAQMRKLAARFSAEIGAWPAEGWTELRFMPQPLYRYASEKDGVIDGALFALAVANDPEVLVQLEAVQNTADGEARWNYSLARMSAIWMKVRLDREIVWEAEGYWLHPRSVNDPYMENFGVQYRAPVPAPVPAPNE